MSSIKVDRERFRDHVAPHLASLFGPWLRPFQTTAALSKRFVFLDDGDRLIVIAGDQEHQDHVGLALTFGLAWHGDRDLVLVLPKGKDRPTLDRVAYLRPFIRVFTHDGRSIVEAIIPARHEVLASYDDALEVSEKDLGDRAAWITPLVGWADAHPHLQPSHRPSYRAWHCNGRLVLRVQAAAGKSLRVTAGVHASRTSEKYTELLPIALSGPIDADQLAALTSRAQQAIDGRLAGSDNDHLEHLLQASLSRAPHLLGLLDNEPGEPRQFFRELPCRRPGAARNYIDLAGVDDRDVFHVVETKIGGDEMLVLQGLDYYIWALAHRNALAVHLKRPNLRVAVDFVVASQSALEPAIGPYTARQLEALDGSIPWQVASIEGWKEGKPSIARHGRRRFPPDTVAAAPVTGARYAERVREHRVSVAGPLQRDRVSVVEIGTAIHPAAQHVWDDLQSRSALHRWAAHVSSSQAFAINLFGPFDKNGAARMLEQFFGPIIGADAPVFEFEDAADRLAESTPKRPHRTQADVVMRGTTTDGRAVALMVEVKLTEDDFGHCSAYQNEANDRLDVCRQPGAFGGDTAACFQLRNHGNGAQRTYDEYIPPIGAESCGCSFRRSVSQPMRNLALAGVLEIDGFEVKFALCAPAAHRSIWRRWDEVNTVFEDDRLTDLPAEQVAAMHEDAVRSWLAHHYRLGDAVKARVANSLEWSTWAVVAELTARYDREFRVIETHPGGGQYDCITLYDVSDKLGVVQMNRAGRVHAMNDGEMRPVDQMWEVCRRQGPAAAADRLAMCLGLRRRDQPVDVPWYEFAELVNQSIDDGRSVSWHNGMLDTSGIGGGVRIEWYEDIGRPAPSAGEGGPFPDHAAYADWFLVDSSDNVVTHRGIASAESR